MTEEILVKFLNNRCSSEELAEVFEWININALKDSERILGFHDWNSYQEQNEFDDNKKFDSLLDKIHHKINIESNKNKVIETKSRNLSFLKVLTRAAAILLIPVLFFLIYNLSKNGINSFNYAQSVVDTIEVMAPIGSRTLVHLSDGSDVHLNYGSKLKYPQKFVGDTREVILVGEGYFDVTHNPEKPFIVNAGKLSIKAIGTSFNVNAYSESEEIATTLVSGKVVIEKTLASGKTTKVGSMEPGQHVSYNVNTDKIYSSMGVTEKYIAWKAGKLVFDNEPIDKVANKLSRMFNVEIDVADDIRNYTYTVTIIDEPLFQILDLMTVATPVTYKAFPRIKQPDGSFSKQKITINKR